MRRLSFGRREGIVSSGEERKCMEKDSHTWHYRHYGPGENVEIKSIDVRIDIAAIYQGLDFEEAEPGEE